MGEIVKYDVEVKIDLNSPEGNAFNIMAKVSQALRSAGIQDYIREYQNDTMSGDYLNLIEQTERRVIFGHS